MDLDDIFPASKPEGTPLGAELSQLSIAELQERIEALKAEISRVEQELGARQSFRSAAEDVFKS